MARKRKAFQSPLVEIQPKKLHNSANRNNPPPKTPSNLSLPSQRGNQLTFLKEDAVIGEELPVVLRFLAGFVHQEPDYPILNDGPQLSDKGGILQHLSTEVERNVFAVHDTFGRKGDKSELKYNGNLTSSQHLGGPAVLRGIQTMVSIWISGPREQKK